MGDVIESTDPEGRKTTTSYDKRRRAVAVTNHAGETTQTTYDAVGNHLSTTRPLGNSTSLTYDGANRLKTIQDSIGGTTRYDYDKADNHTALTDARSNITTTSYDELNRRQGIAYPGGATESFAYDATGNLTTHTDGNGIIVTHVFDELNREINKSYSLSADGLTGIATKYDAHNNVTLVTQSMSSGPQVSTYSYDHFDRLEKHTDPFGAQAITTYDANGNKTSLITQDGKITRYSYDALNRLTGIVGQSGSITYGYDRSSLNTSIGYSNGVTSTRTYDAAKRVKSVIHAKGGSNLSRTDYDYDKNGNRLKETINRVAGAQVTGYSYDPSDRLTKTVVTDTAKTVTTDYTLDAVANRTAESIATKPVSGTTSTLGKTYTYDGRNQLTGMTDSVAGNTVLTYDAQGNLIQKTQGSDLTTYDYNARDNLIKVTKNATVLGSYGNDHLGLRVEKEATDPLQPGAPPVRLRTFWEGRNAFQDSDTGGTVVSRYETDGHRPVSMWSKDDGSQALHQDALGSVVATTDSSGKLKSETIYDAYGNIVTETGQSANKFGYTGHQMDKETGLIYFQARYYDPQTGRFITQDPFEGDWTTPLSLHHYLYAYANPTVYVDLHGYESVLPYVERIEKPYDVNKFGKGEFTEKAKDFADGLTAKERLYGEYFKLEKVDSKRLSEAQAARAKELFGTGADAAEKYANWQARANILNHYTYTHPATIGVLKTQYRTYRDLNPLHFALERGYQVGSGEEMFTGEKVNRARSGAEFLTALAGIKITQVVTTKVTRHFTGESSSSPSSAGVDNKPTPEQQSAIPKIENPGRTQPYENGASASPSPGANSAGSTGRNIELPKIQAGTALDELKQLPTLTGKTTSEIEGLLQSEGYTSVPANNGGKVWTKNSPDGNTAVVRVDPATVRKPPKGFADEVRHAHKEIVPTSEVSNGNYSPGKHVKTLDDNCCASKDPRQIHIQIK